MPMTATAAMTANIITQLYHPVEVQPRCRSRLTDPDTTDWPDYDTYTMWLRLPIMIRSFRYLSKMETMPDCSPTSTTRSPWLCSIMNGANALLPGATYTYRVRAVNTDDGGEL